MSKRKKNWTSRKANMMTAAEIKVKMEASVQVILKRVFQRRG